MASWVAGPKEGPGPVDAADVGSVADCKAEIARLKNEVQRLSALVAQKDELLAHADRIHLKLHAELQAHTRKQRGEKKPRRIPGDPQQASHTTSAVAGSHARDAMQTQDREPHACARKYHSRRTRHIGFSAGCGGTSLTLSLIHI